MSTIAYIYITTESIQLIKKYNILAKITNIIAKIFLSIFIFNENFIIIKNYLSVDCPGILDNIHFLW